MVHFLGLALRLTVALTIAGAASLGLWQSQSPPGNSYGYSREEDPLVLGVKQALGQAHSGDWKGVQETRQTLATFLEELDPVGELELASDLDAAIQSQDAAAVAQSLAHLTFQALRRKLAENERERLDQPVPARTRLEAARFYYQEILSPGVLQADALDHTERHRAILDDLDAMRRALGSAGLFGLGERPSDLAEFRSGAREIMEEICVVYPDFVLPAATDPDAGEPPP